MMCYVEIVVYPESCVAIRTQGEFDETINTYDVTNYVTIQKGTHQDFIAQVS